ncbi:Ribonuclease H2, subunit B [Moelleriella libera RCEF 2490]|uniref:Ribonuclease H2 subunit B n=1 Tax=Moelleriella libera RCEF 2490 TaxID=1081109 RepID=A0A167YJR2_9HYPO|nr:Ribonuclease H2, subunit B [Moelleriella libera RCEF 2490]
MSRTRSKRPADTQATETAESTLKSKYALTPSPGPAPHLFILPKDAGAQSRIVTLPHPRNGQPSRYLVCPETGIYEFTSISAPKPAPRSWLIETEAISQDGNSANNDEANTHAEMISASELYVATPFDPLFLVLPALAEAKVAKGSEEKRRMFLSSDDHLDKLLEEKSHLADLLLWATTRNLIESRIEAVCDTVDAGDEKMFRINEKKLLTTLREKAKRMGEGSLPPSLEEKFVKSTLDAPILLQKRDAKPLLSHEAVETSLESTVSTLVTDAGNSQSTLASTTPSSPTISQPSTATTSMTGESLAEDVAMTAIQASPEIINLQRLRVAFDFICCRYVPPAIAERLKTQLRQVEVSSVDFAPLDDYLARLAELRAEAVVASSAVDYSRKRFLDEEQEELRAEKKRKLEEEKKRKANESRGVRDLKKVNTSGMMKLSHFFKAK